jgi:hypothetical protein
MKPYMMPRTYARLAKKLTKFRRDNFRAFDTPGYLQMVTEFAGKMIRVDEQLLSFVGTAHHMQSAPTSSVFSETLWMCSQLTSP